MEIVVVAVVVLAVVLVIDRNAFNNYSKFVQTQIKT